MLTAVAGLLLATSCSSSFLDTEPTDAVSFRSGGSSRKRGTSLQRSLV